MQELDLEKANKLLKEVPEINKYINQNVRGFVEVVNEGNYRKMEQRFGKECVTVILNHHIKKENYPECVQIRDRFKRKKATGN